MKYLIILAITLIFSIQDAIACSKSRTVTKVAVAPVVVSVRVATAPFRLFTNRTVTRTRTNQTVVTQAAPIQIAPQAQDCPTCPLPTKKK